MADRGREEGDRPPRADEPPPSGAVDATDGETDRQALRAAVEERYDFENFGPADMDRMTVEEWEAVFDPGTWITGPALLDRVEADLKDRVRRRTVFAVIERLRDGGEDRVLAYSDEGYALVHPDGTVKGEGAVLRDVEPVVAVCSMPEYEPPEMPEGPLLPDPRTVSAGSGDLGNRLLQVVAGVQLLAGLLLLLAPVVVGPLIRSLCTPGAGVGTYTCAIGPLRFDAVLPGRSVVLTTVVGLGFLFIGVLLLILVANARLSDRFRAEEYRDRLYGIGVGVEGGPSPPSDIDDLVAGREVDAPPRAAGAGGTTAGGTDDRIDDGDEGTEPSATDRGGAADARGDGPPRVGSSDGGGDGATGPADGVEETG